MALSSSLSPSTSFALMPFGDNGSSNDTTCIASAEGHRAATRATSVLNGSPEDPSRAADTPRSSASKYYYREILGDLCLRIEGSSFYSGSSSTWFLRGALAKHEEKGNLPSGEAFYPQGLTDALLERLLLAEHRERNQPSGDHLKGNSNCNENNKDSNENIDSTNLIDTYISNDSVGDGVDGGKAQTQSDPDYETCLLVAKALAADPLKYLPAITASLSDLVAISSPPSTTPLELASVSGSSSPTIPFEFLQLWIAAAFDARTPQDLCDKLSDSLFIVFRLQWRLYGCSEDDSSLLPVHALRCLAGDEHSDDSSCNGDNELVLRETKGTTPRWVPDPDPVATLRRAFFLVRFLGRSSSFGEDLPEETKKLVIARISGALGWFAEILRGPGKHPQRQRKKHREIRSGLLDLLLDEFKSASKNNDNANGSNRVSVEWLSAPELVAPTKIFFRNAFGELVEDWGEDMVSSPPLSNPNTDHRPPFSRNRDVLSGKNRGALRCATRFVRFLSRLPPNAAGGNGDSGCDNYSDYLRDGKDLLVTMLSEQGVPLQRLRLVHLLIEEFRDSSAVAATGVGMTSMAASTTLQPWLSSPGMIKPVLEECSRDPFLGSSEVALRYLGAYGPRNGILIKGAPTPREAPAPRAFPPSGVQLGIAHTVLTESPPPRPSWKPLASWVRATAASVGEGGQNRLRVLRSRMGDRHSWLTTQEQHHDHYDLFDWEDAKTTAPAR